MTYAAWRKQARRTFLIQTLNDAKGNQCVAAEELGVHRNTLARMMKQDGIPPPGVVEIRNAQPYVQHPSPLNYSRRIYRLPTRGKQQNVS